jgi:hypothetical protein
MSPMLYALTKFVSQAASFRRAGVEKLAAKVHDHKLLW